MIQLIELNGNNISGMRYAAVLGMPGMAKDQ
ncbi:MAG: hypothetical protein K0S36_645 [Nitrosospira multiformis]|jgi:hypothetical protein|nr:hypothetical protein [Nitrosospira multiformis]